MSSVRQSDAKKGSKGRYRWAKAHLLWEAGEDPTQEAKPGCSFAPICLPLTARGLHACALIAGFPPPIRTLPGHRSVDTTASMELYAKLLVLKHRAQQVSGTGRDFEPAGWEQSRVKL